MAESKFNKNLGQKILSTVKSVTENSQANQNEATKQLVQKLESVGLDGLSKEEVNQLKEILTEVQAQNPEVQQILGQVKTFIQVKTVQNASDKGLKPIQSSAQKAAMKEFTEDVQMGVSTKDAVDKATQKAFEQAVDMGASKEEAQEAALKVRETIVEQLNEVSSLEEMSDIRASQVDFGSSRGKEKPVAEAQEAPANTNADGKTDQDNAPSLTTDTQSSTDPQINTNQQASENQASEPTFGITAETVLGSTGDGRADDAAEQILSSDNNLGPLSSVVMGAEGAASATGAGNVSFESGTRVVTQNLGNSASEISNSDLVGNFVAQQIDKSGELKTAENEIGQLQDSVAAGDFTESGDSVGQGEVPVDIVQVVEQVEVEEAAADTFLEIPPTEVRVAITEVSVDPDGTKSIFSFEINKDFIGNPSQILWELDGNAPEEVKQKWPTQIESFAATEQSRTITIEIDGVNLPVDEQFTIKIKPLDAQTFILSQSEDSTRGFQSNANVSISAKQDTLKEGDSNHDVQYEFLITRDRVGGEASFDWSLDELFNGISKDDFSDGVIPSGNVTFQPGETEKLISFYTRGDRNIEANEDFVVRLSTSSEISTITQATASSQIANDDASFRVDAVTNNIFETRSGESTTLRWEVSRNLADGESSINWNLKPGNFDLADVGGELPSGVINFQDGELVKLIEINIPGDEFIEEDTHFNIELSQPGNNSTIDFNAINATNTLLTDDIGFNILPITANTLEGHSDGTQTLTYKVIRSVNLDEALDIEFKVEGLGLNRADVGDFKSGSDSLNIDGMPSGLIEFGIGETEKTITLNISGDNLAGNDKDLAIRLINPPEGTRLLIDNQLGTIQNDDSIVTFTAAEATDEGNTGNTILTINFSRTGNLEQSITVDYTLSGHGENLAEIVDLSNISFPTGTIQFAANQSATSISIPITPESLLEGHEYFRIDFSNPVGAEVLGSGSYFTINPDESVLSISDTKSILSEGGSSGKTHKFLVTRSGDTGEAVTFQYTVKAAPTDSVDVSDFGGTFTTETMTFASGETSKIIEITPSADFTFETNENYIVEITSSQAGVVIVKSEASGTIVNDDSALTISDVSLNGSEGDSGSSNFEFRVDRIGSLLDESTVDWKLIAADGNAVDANDFKGGELPSGTITFSRTENIKTVSVNVQGDQFFESTENFKIVLENPSQGTTILNGEITGTINNDDVSVSIVSNDPSKLEGQIGNTDYTFTITREGDLSGSDTIDYLVQGTGTNPTDSNDFAGNVFSSGTVSFAADESSKTITISTLGDSQQEADETFEVLLQNPSAGVEIGAGTAQATITDDDDELTLSLPTNTVVEGSASNSNTITYLITRSGSLNTTTTVDYAVTGTGTNSADSTDFSGGVLPSGTITFAPNENSKQIVINLSADNTLENDETFKLTLSNPSSGTSLGTSHLDGTIQNDDSGLTVQATTTDITEGSGANSTHTFTVTRNGIIDNTNVVDWTVTGTGANPTDANDFTAVSGQITFAAGETSKTINLDVLGDLSVENTENFQFAVNSGSADDDLVSATADGSIISDDAGLSIVAINANTTEGEVGASTTVEFTVTRSGDSSSTATADWTISGDVDAADFGGSLPSGTVSFNPNINSQTISLIVSGDALLENDETINVNLSNPNAGTAILNANASTIVTNDDSRLELNNPITSITEGNAGNTEVTFTVTRNGVITEATTAKWKVIGFGDQPALLNDFIGGQDLNSDNAGLPSGSLNFAAGETTKTITLSLQGDDIVEADDTFQIQFYDGGDNTDVSLLSAVITIPNDDPGLSVTSLTTSQNEGDSGTTTVKFDVIRSGNLEDIVEVDYAFGGDTNAVDFASALNAGTLTFAANQTQITVELVLQGDTIVENDETISITLSNGKIQGTTTPVNITQNTATTTITNEDESFAVSVDNATVTEGNAGQQDITYTVTRSGDTSKSVTLDYALDSSNGADDNDITGNFPSGTFTFAAGEVSKTLTVSVSGDTEVENDENLELTISNPTEGILTISSITSVINNDDQSFGISADAVSQLEGQSGQTAFTFTVTRTGNSSGTANVNYTTSGTGNTVGADFDGNAFPSGVVNFGDGETTKTITINVAGDDNLESNESFTVTLSNPSSGTLTQGSESASSTILSDDDSLSISTETNSIIEGHSGTTDIVFTVTRSDALTTASTVDYTISGVDAADLANGTSLTGTLSFGVDETTKNITVSVKGDTTVESDETMTVTLSNPSSGTNISTSSAQTIISNDDAEFSISASSANKTEGNTGDNPYTFTVTRSGFTNQSNTVDYKLNGTGINPVDTADFSSIDSLSTNSGLPSGTVSFDPGETSKTITINGSGDSILESDEDFNVTLSNPSSGTVINTASAVGQIDNDDAEIVLATTTTTVTEVDSGADSTHTYTVNRSGETNQQSTVTWTITGSDGFDVDTSNGDLSSVVANTTVVNSTGTLSFASGETTKTLSVNVKGDDNVESNENFTITLSDPTSGTSLGSTVSGSGTVTDDDTRFEFSADVSQAEGNGTDSTFTYTVTRTGNLARTTSFDWTLAGHDPDGSNENPAAASDFVGGVFPSGTVTFNSGETTKTITFDVLGDATTEKDEWFKFDISNVSGAETYETSVAEELVLGEILFDESRLDINDSQVTAVGDSTTISDSDEGDAGEPNVTRVYAVNRHDTTLGTATVNWRVTGRGGAGVADSDDFVAGQDLLGDNGGYPSGTLTFADGESVAYFTVNTTTDDTGEDDEEIQIRISEQSTGHTISDSYAAHYIVNDDPLIKPVTSLVGVSEGTDGDYTQVSVLVNRIGTTAGTVDVDWAMNFTGSETTNESTNDTSTWYKADPSDFKTGDPTSGTLTFADGESQKTLTFNVVNDSLTETFYEGVTIDFSNVVAGAGSLPIELSEVLTSTQIRILDDEPDPEFTVSAIANQLEGTGGSNTIDFTVTRSDVDGRPGDLSTSHGILWNTSTSSFSSHFESSQSGTLIFAPNETTKTISIQTQEDDDIESDRNITLTISNWESTSGTGSGQVDSNANSATVTMVDDDMRLWASDVSVVEGDDGTTSLELTVTRRGYTGSSVSMDYSIDTSGDLTAEAADFIATSGTITMDAGKTSQTFQLGIIATDSITEGDETFEVDLSNPSDGALFDETSNTAGSSTATFSGIIEDDDTLFSIANNGANTVAESNTGQTGSFNFTISREAHGDDEPATINWKVTGNGVDQADAADFTTNDDLGTNNGFPSGTVSFGQGETSKIITVQTTGDNSAELDEGFKVTISDPSTGKLGTAEATATIQTDDAGIAIADASAVNEGDTGTTSINFTVTRSGDTTVTSSADYGVTNLTTSADDFSGTTNGTVTFSPGETSKTITIQVNSDNNVEGNETFKVVLSNLSGILDSIDLEADAIINNDDSNFSIVANAAVQDENTGGNTFDITRDTDTPQIQTIRWTVSGSEVDSTDFGGVLPTNTVTFNPGELTKTITINPSPDSNGEADENFDVTITDENTTDGVNISGTNTAVGTITNDDAVLDIATTSTTITEGDSNSTFSFTVTRSGDTSGASDVEWKLSSQSAGLTTDDFVAGQDILGTNFGLPSGTINWLTGETDKTVTIQIVGDLVVEDQDDFRLTLSNPTSAEIRTSSVDVSITQEDSVLSLTADSATKAESNSGTNNYDFTITRTGDLTDEATVEYTVSGGADVDASDFVGSNLPSGTVTLAAGQSTTTLSIPISGDIVAENDETFTVTLSNPSINVDISDATETGLIQTDDIQFDVYGPTIDNLTEVDTGANTDFVFTITRSGLLSGTETVDWAVTGTGSNPLSDDEFIATTGTVTFNPTETSKQVTISVKGDSIGEADVESFSFTITAPTGTYTGNRSVDANLIENEAVLAITSSQNSLNEGTDGSLSAHTFTVTRSGNTANAVSVDYSVTDSGNLEANDFENATLPSGVINFAAGETTKTITVNVAGDASLENDETFTVTLSNPSSGAAVSNNSADSIITNDDTDWTTAVAGSGASVAEGDSNTTTFTATVSRSGLVNQAATIDYAIIGSGSDSASQADFNGSVFPAGTLSFSSGETTKTLTFDIATDSLEEANEGFRLTISNPTGSGTNNLVVSSVDFIILNDDDTMSIASTQTTILEGDTTDAELTFTVTRSGNSSGNSTIDWRLASSSDTDTSDFDLTSDTLVFADGETSKDVTIKIKGDTLVESDESFIIELHNPSAGTSVSTTEGTIQATIQNQDIDLTPSATTLNVEEGDSDGGNFVFTITRTGDTSVQTTVDYKVNGLDTDSNDFASGQDGLATNSDLPSGSVTFDIGETAKQVTLKFKEDGIVENDENYQIELFNPSGNAEINSGVLDAVMGNDDDTLSIVAINASKNEGDNGDVTDFEFRVDRGSSSDGEASVTWTVTGTGENPLDISRLVSNSGTINFADGESSKTLNVQLNGDEIGKFDQTFTVTLSDPSFGSSIISATGVATVINDDPVLLLSSVNPVITETDTGGFILYTVTRSGGLDSTASVNFGIKQDSTPNQASEDDFQGGMPEGVLTFQPGETTKVISIPISTDSLGEFDEVFTLQLSNASGADVIAGEVSTSITNDDTAIAIQANSVELNEGDTGTTTFTYTVTRTGPVTGTSTVDWHVVPTGDYHVDSTDFVTDSIPSGSITFLPDETSKTISFDVKSDSIPGKDETFEVQLSNSLGADIIRNSAAGTIMNDDSEVFVLIDTANQNEGDTGVLDYVFRVARTGNTGLPATVDYRIEGYGEDQVDGIDFVGGSLPSGTVNFAAGESEKLVTIQVNADSQAEDTETFSFILENPGTNVSIKPAGTVANASIINDDTGIYLKAEDNIHDEGSTDNNAFTFELNRFGVVDQALSVDWNITGSGSNPTNQDDFMASSGTVEFAADELSKQITIISKADTVIEADEHFTLTVSKDGLDIPVASANGVLVNDDTGFRVNARVNTVNENVGNVIFDVSRSGPTDEAVDISYQVGGTTNSPVEGQDFTENSLANGILSFAAGEATKEIILNIDDDALVEINETLTMTISNLSNVRIIDSTDSVLIQDNDSAGTGNDVVTGDNTAQTLEGFDGDDLLYGELGSDTLIGGAGSDRFVYNDPSEGSDYIADMVVGQDKIRYESQAFQNLQIQAKANQTELADLQSTITGLASQVDSDLYTLDLVNQSFSHEAGENGHLDELESAFTAAEHTGAAFIAISDGNSTKLYYDADTATGSDGSGLVEIAQIQSVNQASNLTEESFEAANIPV